MSATLELPNLKKATADADALARKVDTARTKLARYLQLLTPPSEHAQIDPLDRLDAEANVAATRVEVAKLERDYLKAQRAISDMRTAARDQIRASFDARERQAVAAFKAALLAARDANAALQAVQFEKHTALAEVFDPLSWPEFTLRLDQWLATVDPLLGEHTS